MIENTFQGKYKFDAPFSSEWQDTVSTPINIANAKWKYKFTCDTNLLNSIDNYNEYVESFSRFIAEVYAQYFGHGNAMPWFRGQANRDWHVIPGFLREDAVQTIFSQTVQKGSSLSIKLIMEERHIMQQFINEASIIRPEIRDVISWYILAQHYGLPTRLLDWSTSPLTALWMALENGSDTEDGIIISINPNGNSELDKDKIYWNNERILDLFSILCGKDFSSSEKTALLHDMLRHEAIIPYYPSFFDGRLARQQAKFTLHTPAASEADKPFTIGINDRFPVKEFIISKKAKPYLRNFLLMMGVQNWHVMPDLEHVAMGIRNANFVTRK